MASLRDHFGAGGETRTLTPRGTCDPKSSVCLPIPPRPHFPNQRNTFIPIEGGKI